MKKIVTTILAAAGVMAVQAAVTLPEQVCDYMVLQRDTVANIWGWATPGAAITVTGDWNNVPVTVKADKKGAWVAGSWKESEPANAPQFTAIGYTFACAFSDIIGVPVGVIRAAYGGSKVEGWMPKEIVAKYPDINLKDADVYDEKLHYYRPTVMYNAMLYSVSKYTAKGFLWNQGESNVGKHDTYPDRLYAMVKEWRRLWGDDKDAMSFYQVQLPGYDYDSNLNGLSGPLMREAQLEATDMIPNCGMVTSIDLQQPGQYRQIHPARKAEIGERLAWMAVARNYGVKGIKCESPRLKNVEFKGDKAVVYLIGGEDGVGPRQGIVGFEVAGADRVFHPAEAVNEAVWPEPAHLTVSSPEVKEIKSVRYCFKNWPEGNVISLMGLPLLPFRTDNW